MAKPYLSIVIPAYNEAHRVGATLLDIDRRLEKASFSYEIIVVNDGSKDNTAEVVERLKPAVRNLKLIDNAENKGKGGVVRQGMLLAGGTVRLFTDADNSTSIDQFEKLIPYFKQGYGVVIGSRRVKGAKLDPPETLFRQVAARGLNWIVQVLLLWGIQDSQCGFKAFTEDAAKNVFEVAGIRGWGFDVEVLALAKRMNYRIAEVPVHWVNDFRSHVKMSAGLYFLKDVFTVWWRLRRGEYGLLDGERNLAA